LHSNKVTHSNVLYAFVNNPDVYAFTVVFLIITSLKRPQIVKYQRYLTYIQTEINFIL